MDPTIPQPAPSHQHQEKSQGKEMKIMEQGEEMWQTKKQEAQNTTQEVEVKQCPSPPVSLSESSSVFICCKIRRLQCNAMLFLGRDRI
jgi:hypothetical protein